ncbi:MAG: DUF6090 family protein [Longimicrobiales bacterium]
MADGRSRIAWGKLALEALVLVVSVYLAIVLEGFSDERARHREAVEALRTLRAELVLDGRDLEVVMAAQRDRHLRNRRIDRWLQDPDTAPTDSLAADFRALFSENRTMFPRSASWTTMVASGQLNDLNDPGLVSELADFYENRNARLEYNGRLYDEWVTEVARGGLPVVWDQASGRFLTRDRTEIDRLRGRLTGTADLGHGFYGLLEEWSVALESLTAGVDAYLAR